MPHRFANAFAFDCVFIYVYGTERGEILIKYVVCFEYIGSVNVTTTNISFVVLYVNLFEFIAYLYSVCLLHHTAVFFPSLLLLLLFSPRSIHYTP